MVEFTFVTDEALRASLEADYAELASSMQGSAWKAVHVLAGSIIEALLVDYLLATDYQTRTGQDPLRMELAPLIAACRAEGVLSERAEHLSTVVRGYRNLIHPGRVVRLNEKSGASTAKIVEGLVELIVDEISEQRQATYGYTAEQLVAKLEVDDSALAILDHYFQHMQAVELRRLLLKVIPQRYFERTLVTMGEPVGQGGEVGEVPESGEHYQGAKALIGCFRPAFQWASDDIKREVTRHFVELLQRGTADQVVVYGAFFFSAGDLQYLDADEATLVKRHILSRGNDPKFNLLAFLGFTRGVGPFLTEAEAQELAYALYRVASREPVGELQKHSDSLVYRVLELYSAMTPEAQGEFLRPLDQAIEAWNQRGQQERVAVFEQVRRTL